MLTGHPGESDLESAISAIQNKSFEDNSELEGYHTADA